MLSVYNRLTNLIAVRDVMTPLTVTVSASWTLRQAIEHADEVGAGDTSLPYLVRGDEGIVGFTRYWDLRSALEDSQVNDSDDPNRSRVSSEAEPIGPDVMIAADTSLWRAAHVMMDHWDEQRVLFVLEGSEIVGTLSYRDFFRPPFRVCLFALTLELEQESLNLCLRDPTASWRSLPDGRRQKAGQEMERQQFLRAPQSLAPERIDELAKHPFILLEYTMFIDKKTMLSRCNLLPSVDQGELNETFDTLQDLRNWCVHTTGGDEPFITEPRQLLKQVFACHKLLAKIREALELPLSGPG